MFGDGWQWFVVTSTVSGFFVIHKTEYARKFIEAEIASSPFWLTAIVLGVPVSQENIPVFGCKVGFANRASELRA